MKGANSQKLTAMSQHGLQTASLLTEFTIRLVELINSHQAKQMTMQARSNVSRRCSLCLHDHVKSVDSAYVGQSSVDWVWETDILLDLFLPEALLPEDCNKEYLRPSHRHQT